MKKIIRAVVLAAAMTMLFALPVLAGDDKVVKISSENTDTLIQLTDAYNLQTLAALENVSKFASSDAAMADAKNHMEKVYAQLKHEDQDIANNHLYYLQQVVNNDTELARVKLEVVNNYKNLGATNPYYLSLVPQAEADYQAALVKVNADQNYLEVAKLKLAKYFQ